MAECGLGVWNLANWACPLLRDGCSRDESYVQRRLSIFCFTQPDKLHAERCENRKSYKESPIRTFAVPTAVGSCTIIREMLSNLEYVLRNEPTRIQAPSLGKVTKKLLLFRIVSAPRVPMRMAKLQQIRSPDLKHGTEKSRRLPCADHPACSLREPGAQGERIQNPVISKPGFPMFCRWTTLPGLPALRVCSECQRPSIMTTLVSAG